MSLKGQQASELTDIIKLHFGSAVDPTADFDNFVWTTLDRRIYDWTSTNKYFHLQVSDVLRELRSTNLDTFLDALAEHVSKDGDGESDSDNTENSGSPEGRTDEL